MFIKYIDIGEQKKLQKLHNLCLKHYETSRFVMVFAIFIALSLVHVHEQFQRRIIPNYMNPPPTLDELCDLAAPSILESKDIKLAFLLSVVGAKTITEDQQRQSPEKTSIHTLILGNPSSGKSQIASWFEVV